MQSSMSKAPRPLRTAQEVKKDFERRGITINQWARENGFWPAQVHQLLTGKSKGRYGAAHRIAVRLGMKDGVEEAN